MVARRAGKTPPSSPRRPRKTLFWSQRQPDGTYRLGFTRAAQRRLGELVYLRCPKIGRRYGPQEPALTLESEKCVRELTLPVAGRVVETNRELERDPSAVNRDPYGKGWVFVVRPQRSRTLESATQAPPRNAR